MTEAPNARMSLAKKDTRSGTKMAAPDRRMVSFFSKMALREERWRLGKKAGRRKPQDGRPERKITAREAKKPAIQPKNRRFSRRNRPDGENERRAGKNEAGKARGRFPKQTEARDTDFRRISRSARRPCPAPRLVALMRRPGRARLAVA